MQRVPPLTANLGQACYKCFKNEDKDVSLLRCTKCRRVYYCSPECQKLNWADHKTFCKASHDMENNSAFRSTLCFSLAPEPSTDSGFLNMIAGEQATNKLQFLQLGTRRPLHVFERNLVGWEPRCMGCTRTDQHIRMEASQPQSTPSAASTRHALAPCPDCKMTFYCSENHWDAIRHIHTAEPCEDGHDGLTQCQMHQEIRGDIAFANIMAGAGSPSGGFQWAPDRVKESWVSLQGMTWTGEFMADLTREFNLTSGPVVEPWLHSASDALSMPMTILWALENLNDGDSWTRKETLTIHILGAHDKEVLNAQVFEEILHRLPEIKILKLILCGPEIAQLVSVNERGKVIDMETCRDCHQRGRKRLHQHHDDTYHVLTKRLGEKFIRPDLAIAFNSGSSEQAVGSWQDTIKFLVKAKIPTVFTAYNREEAETEAKILRREGATLLPILGPKKNPWGSILAKKEPSKVLGFYAVNGWLAGGFK